MIFPARWSAILPYSSGEFTGTEHPISPSSIAIAQARVELAGQVAEACKAKDSQSAPESSSLRVLVFLRCPWILKRSHLAFCGHQIWGISTSFSCGYNRLSAKNIPRGENCRFAFGLQLHWVTKPVTLSTVNIFIWVFLSKRSSVPVEFKCFCNLGDHCTVTRSGRAWYYV